MPTIGGLGEGLPHEWLRREIAPTAGDKEATNSVSQYQFNNFLQANKNPL
jgi:hypothetical protein